MRRVLSLVLVLCLILIPVGNAAASDAADDRIVAAGETWKLSENAYVNRLEIEDGAVIEADHPVIVFFEESDSVHNGDVIGEVQFVSDYS